MNPKYWKNAALVYFKKQVCKRQREIERLGAEEQQADIHANDAMLMNEEKKERDQLDQDPRSYCINSLKAELDQEGERRGTWLLGLIGVVILLSWIIPGWRKPVYGLCLLGLRFISSFAFLAVGLMNPKSKPGDLVKGLFAVWFVEFGISFIGEPSTPMFAYDAMLWYLVSIITKTQLTLSLFTVFRRTLRNKNDGLFWKYLKKKITQICQAILLGWWSDIMLKFYHSETLTVMSRIVQVMALPVVLWSLIDIPIPNSPQWKFLLDIFLNAAYMFAACYISTCVQSDWETFFPKFVSNSYLVSLFILRPLMMTWCLHIDIFDRTSYISSQEAIKGTMLLNEVLIFHSWEEGDILYLTMFAFTLFFCETFVMLIRRRFSMAMIVAFQAVQCLILRLVLTQEHSIFFPEFSEFLRAMNVNWKSLSWYKQDLVHDIAYNWISPIKCVLFGRCPQEFVKIMYRQFREAYSNASEHGISISLET